MNHLPKSNSMKTILFADDTVLVQSNNNLGKLQNSVIHEMTEVTDWLTPTPPLRTPLTRNNHSTSLALTDLYETFKTSIKVLRAPKIWENYKTRLIVN